MTERPFDAQMIVAANEAARHGMPAVTISADAAAAGLFPTTFPKDDVLVVFSGPPGRSVSVIVWMAEVGTVEDVVASKYNTRPLAPLTLGVRETAEVFGGPMEGLTFHTGEKGSHGEMAWFAIQLRRAGVTLLVAFGAPVNDATGVPSASETLAHPALQSLMRTLAIK